MTTTRSLISRIALAGALAFAFAAVMAASAMADPTRPGDLTAAGAVYTNADQGAVLGDEPPPPLVDPPALPSEPALLGDEPAAAKGAGADAPVAVRDEGAGVKSIPFTGFAALVMLGVGVALVTTGAVLRFAVRRPGAFA